VGAWINLCGLTVLALRRGWMWPDGELGKVAVATFFAGGLLALAASLGLAPAQAFAETLPYWRNEALIAILAVVGAIVYALALAVAALAMGLRFGRLTPAQYSPSP
jgi:hypothetical protein